MRPNPSIQLEITTVRCVQPPAVRVRPQQHLCELSFQVRHLLLHEFPVMFELPLQLHTWHAV